MKELKFRAWGINIKEYLKDADGSTNCVYILGDLLKQGNWIFEQYTGLKDKNGKEIYEGDIVELDWYIYGDKPAYKVKSEVIFDEEGVRVCNGKHSDLLKYCTGIEVIGNIHENKELLGGEE